MSALRRAAPWGLLTSIGILAYAGMALADYRTGTLRAATTPTTIALYLMAFAGFVLAMWWNERHPINMRLVWLAAVVFRLTLISTTPTLSDDVYRYLWDGHLVAEGVNPYSYAIDAPELDPFEIPERRLANNPQLSSPYLPVAHGLFAAVDIVLPRSPRTMQLTMAAFDLATAFVLSRLLAIAGQPARRLLLYLWNPLIIVETAHAAHLDAVMAFLVVAAFWAAVAPMSRVPRWLSPLALAAATLTRLIPAIVAPVLWWRWTWLDRIAFVSAVVVAMIPFSFGVGGWGLSGETVGVGVFGSARVYSREFRFNAGIANWLESAMGLDSVIPAVLVGAAMLLVLGMVLVAGRRHAVTGGTRLEQIASDRRLLRLACVPLAGYVLLTPVLHPWYVIPLMVMLIFVAPVGHESGDRWLLLVPWLYLTASNALSYLTYRDPAAYAELGWIRAVEWYPTLVLLVATHFWVFFAIQAEPAATEFPDQEDCDDAKVRERVTK